MDFSETLLKIVGTKGSQSSAATETLVRRE